MISKRIHIQGLVQGVGFRPYIYRIAVQYNIKGWVENGTDGVYIYAMAEEKVLGEFIAQITKQAPAASSIFSIDIDEIEPLESSTFEIRKSRDSSMEITEVSPDIAVCNDCLEDMQKQPHRLNYPFINCTNCGPRFSIIRELPYDRHNTTMEPFIMCPVCREEYENVLDRRFHAQPVACNSCGPKYTLHYNGKAITDFNEILATSASLLDMGKILAIKGMGGYHLACDAKKEEAVSRLRSRKVREGKPFATMFRDLETIRKYLVIGDEEERELTSWRRPIVILPNKSDTEFLAFSVSVGFKTTGAMLPYMPFHYLLFDRLITDAIVLTSGNISDEPIIISNESALEQFSTVADGVITYNRDIYNRTDDSVEVLINGTPRMVRRSRGFAPSPVRLGINVEGIFAAGAELVNCFALGRGNQAILSQHIGDLQNLETLDFYTESVKRFMKLFRVSPSLIVHDLHPDYLSTRFAKNMHLNTDRPIEIVAVQHHHAHIAACMAEYDLDEKVIGVSFDGVGLGDDGNIWGGEFMVCDLTRYERRSHFEYIPMPGGDQATRQPWRMGISYLYKTYGNGMYDLELPLLRKLNSESIKMILTAIDRGINCPLTSSAGRLFDAVAALTGICTEAAFHAEAPMKLENAIDDREKGAYEVVSGPEIKVRRLIEQIVDDIQSGVPASVISARFHNYIIDTIHENVTLISEQTGIKKVVLSGGSFQNRYILERIENRLAGDRYQLFIPSTIPCNDGGIALGQLAIAAKRRAVRR